MSSAGDHEGPESDFSESLRKNFLLRYGNDGADFIVTTGGTGIGKRDITVETVSGMLDEQFPGSVKAVTEHMAEITKTMGRTLFMLHGIDKHPA